VDYLVSKGIDKSRLFAKGYGETMPVAPNTKEDGTDNPEGREMNRRTEFKILSK
jgi:outer membrane protein OmpA-like peptidoglycan-associated protein